MNTIQFIHYMSYLCGWLVNRLSIYISNIFSFQFTSKDDSGFFTMTLGDFVTLLGILVAVYQFNKQMKENRVVASKTQKENWFLNVIVLPQLDSINDFYKEVVSSTLKHKSDLNRSYTVDSAGLALRSARSKIEMKQGINDFFDHITVLVRSYSPEMAVGFSHIVMDLEDICTQILDEQDLYTEEKIRRTILKNKQEIITLLNRGLR